MSVSASRFYFCVHLYESLCVCMPMLAPMTHIPCCYILLPFIRWRFLTGEFNVMPSHGSETFSILNGFSSLLYTAAPLAAPAHVHAARQSNKARINSLLLFSSMRLTTCKHVHDLYSQSHSGPQAFL